MSARSRDHAASAQSENLLAGSGLPNAREHALRRPMLSASRCLSASKHHFTVRIRQFRDKMARIDLGYVRAETQEFAKFLLDHAVKRGTHKAAKTFKAMGASDAEIKAVLPAFGRHGVDAARDWK